MPDDGALNNIHTTFQVVWMLLRAKKKKTAKALRVLVPNAICYTW